MAVTLKIGDRVEVPWGFGTIEGRVLEVYGPPGRRHVVVEIAAPSDVDSTPGTISVPMAAVRHATTSCSPEGTPMRCPLCASGDLRPGETMFAADVDGTVVVVRDVPADICDACGEEFIDDGTADGLERTVVDARTAGTEILVRHHEVP